MENKFKVTKARFIDWYFSDRDTRIDFGNNAISELQNFGSFNVDVNEIFASCLYIPKWLCEGQSKNDCKQIETWNVQLIN
jgi:hypothetical protein